MPIVPNALEDFFTWSMLHAEVWDDAPLTLGLTVVQATGVKTAVSTAQGYYIAQKNAQEAAKSATIKQQAATTLARTAVADAIRSIRAFAELQANPSAVYAAANLPMPATPTPSAPPGTPENFRIGLIEGAVTLKWKCSNPDGTSGTIYEVRRRLTSSGNGPWTFIGATGLKNFTDDTLLAGTPSVTYQVTAVRSTSRGTPGNVIVSFGIGGGGGFTIASVTETTGNVGGKLAA